MSQWNVCAKEAPVNMPVLVTIDTPTGRMVRQAIRSRLNLYDMDLWIIHGRSGLAMPDDIIAWAEMPDPY